MSTGLSSTEVAGSAADRAGAPHRLRRELAESVRAARDVGPLLRFRVAGTRGRGKVAAGAAIGAMVVATVLAAWIPAYLPGADVTRDGADDAFRVSSLDILLLLPSAYLGVLAISIVSASASGGGRELLPRDQAVAFPVSPTTDHLGALLMAPLNIAWLLQSWVVLGATAYVVGPGGLLAAQMPSLMWLLAATALAQLVAWAAEWVRRGPRGAWILRGLIATSALTVAALVSTGELRDLLDRAPTREIALATVNGAERAWGPWLGVVAVEVALAAVAVALGAWMATVANRRPARDELRVETSARTARTNPASDLSALVRTDRVGIWRSVPLRRGLTVLAVFPGFVALAGGLGWEMMPILPGLVASGGALLYGVNAWCLDGRGALWRDSLPVSPDLVFVSRVLVLVEVLLLATGVTLVVASLRAGTPTVGQLGAVLCAAVVVTVQVVAASLRWSVRRPFAVDMRSARATPAPPLVMVGYSFRLAMGTTVVGMLFTLTARGDSWRWSVLLAVPYLLYFALRLARTSRAWADPVGRSRVVTTVAS